MRNFLHTSDLHLTQGSDRDYSLSVWREIVEIATSQKSEAILLCGDTFNDWRDIDALRPEFLKIAKDFSGKLILLPGNHEDLYKPSGESWDRLLFSGLVVVPKSLGYSFWDESSLGFPCQILAFPFQKEDRQFTAELLPAKSPSVLRIGMAHGTLKELTSYTGPSEEEDDSILNLQDFLSASVDYLALGHIHKKAKNRFASTWACYPGSPRVWRKGEWGARSVNLVRWDSPENLQIEEIELKSAGQYQEISLSTGALTSAQDRETNWERALAEQGIAELSSPDFVTVVWKGIIEDENSLKDWQSQLKEKLSVRSLEFDLNSLIRLSSKEAQSPVFLEFRNKIQDLRSKTREASLDPEVKLRKLREIDLAEKMGLEALSDKRNG